MTNAERITELETELVEVRAAKSRALAAGQERSIGGGKSTHQFTEVSYSELIKREKEIISELTSLGWNTDKPHGGAVVIGAGW